MERSQSNNQYLWPNGRVPIKIGFDQVPLLKRLLQALLRFEQKTNIRFVPRNNESDYVEIVLDPGNRSFAQAGRIGGRQYVHLTSNASVVVIQHELMHTLGFLHEQQRPDRNTYLRIEESKLSDNERRDNYDISNQLDFFLDSYDPYSIMHYRCNEVMNYNGNPNFAYVTHNPTDFSQRDIERINYFYPRSTQGLYFREVPVLD